MNRASYREIPALLKAKKPFKGNSMSAYLQPDGTYYVYSYSTMIAAKYSDGSVRLNNNKFSNTTSRHQNLCRLYLEDTSDWGYVIRTLKAASHV